MENKLMITVDEEELFDIMCGFGEVEYKLSNFLTVLSFLKDHYDAEGMKELYANTSVIIGYLTLIQTEFAKTITRTDEFILKQK